MFMVQFTGPPAHVSSAERGRQHENIQYTGCIHSAVFLLSHLNSIYLTQSCRNFQDLLVQASWPLPSLSFTRPEQSNMAQHPPSHWIPRGNSGHCWESLAQVSPLLFKYFYFLFLTLHHTHTLHLMPHEFCSCAAPWYICCSSLLNVWREGRWKRMFLSLRRGCCLFLREAITRGGCKWISREQEFPINHFPAVLLKLLASYSLRFSWL